MVATAVHSWVVRQGKRRSGYRRRHAADQGLEILAESVISVQVRGRLGEDERKNNIPIIESDGRGKGRGRYNTNNNENGCQTRNRSGTSIIEGQARKLRN